MQRLEYYHINNGELLSSEMGMSVRCIGHSAPKPNFQIEKKRKIDYFVISYLSSGRGLFESAQCPETEIEAGSMFILFPGTTHRYGPYPDDEENWSEYWMEVEGFLPSKYLNTKLLNPEQPVINLTVREDLIREWEDALTLARNRKPDYRDLMTGVLLNLLCRMLVFGRSQFEERYDEKKTLIKNVIHMMEKNISKALDISEICSSTAYSYSYIRKLFKKYMNISPERFYSRMKINFAKESLQYSKMSIRDISSQIGIEDPSYFTRVFRKHTGYSPKEYYKRFHKD